MSREELGSIGKPVNAGNEMRWDYFKIRGARKIVFYRSVQDNSFHIEFVMLPWWKRVLLQMEES